MEYVKVQRSGGHFTENLECERLRGAAPSSEGPGIKREMAFGAKIQRRGVVSSVSSTS